MTGLTKEQVEERIQAGKVNHNEEPITRTYKQIILENTLTFFNFLNVVLLALVLFVRSYKNSMFMGIILLNTIIGIVQEIRAKKTIDKLAIMTVSQITVFRDGEETVLPVDHLVLDDRILLKAGDQIPADSRIVQGSLEVNESLLTGEADNLSKTEGDELYSGSFVTAGQAECEIIRVGAENYASKITSEAKEFRRHNSELRNSLNIILRCIGIIILPLGGMLFYKQYVIMKNTLQISVVHTVSAVLGMIPEGLVLLTSVALTLGALALARKKTLVQELYCIETLARVDTLCLDKTGTITEGSMCVERVEILEAETEGDAENPEDENKEKQDKAQTMTPQELQRLMGNLMTALTDKNATAEALRRYFPFARDYSPRCVIPFSSDRKYSGASFAGQGTWLMGAFQFLFPEGNPSLEEKCRQYAGEGLRVLVLTHSEQETEEACLPEGLQAKALILLTDVIREEAPDTLAFFDSQGVDCKVISGDDPVTVASIAERAGLKNADKYVDASMLRTPEELAEAMKSYQVFGRVTPQQKKEMVLALKKQGHTVAMTGDGVNDVLALKEADCSIAMASGSDAAKNIANVVLLTSDFSAMPHIVNQGRRVVNNIRMAASMFLVKTLFSVFLALLTIFFGNSYPFEPIQMSLISFCAVGAPTFLLAQEHNYNKIDNTFLRHVFMNAVPAAVTITGCVFIIMMVCENVYHSAAMMGTACVLATGWNYMATLKTVYSPLNTYRKVIIYGMQLIFFGAAVCLQDLLVLGSLEFGMIILVFVLMTFAPLAIDGITTGLRTLCEKLTQHRAERKRKKSKG
ncbi:MAG: HAD-IC family P-type ATPase [Eubacteriales bacterium]|nr:HAD-IC family P-type ATPase [Eubacteriales bacterium]